MIKAAIIDDEIKSILILRKLLNDHCPEIEIVAEAVNFEEGVKMIHEKQPHLVFLDIEMSDGNGFDMLEQFDPPFFHVIFVTAYSHYAHKAFKVSAVDYILKPIDVEELVDAVKKATPIIEREHKTDPFTAAFLHIRTKQGASYIKPANIIRIEAESSYSRIFVNNGESHTVSYNLGAIENSLDKTMFIRVHKSDIINLNHLKSYHSSGEAYVEMNDGSVVKVSRRSKKTLEDRLKL